MLDIISPAVQISVPILFILLNKYFSKTLNLNGKVAVVTNASIGIGQKICIHLAQYGCNIVIVDVLPADETMRKLQQYGIKARAFIVDSSDKHEVLKFKDEVIKEFGTVDILVNNAAITCYSTIFEHTNEEIEKMMDDRASSVEHVSNYFRCLFLPQNKNFSDYNSNNFYASLQSQMSNTFVEVMKETGSGFIMTISGTHGFSSYPYTPDYSYAKFKIMKFMTRLEILLKRQKLNGIKTMCFSPKMQTILNEEYDS